MLKIKVGDKVKVVAGKDKGKEGVVEKVFGAKSKLLIPEINTYKKHIKSSQDQKGGIFDIERPIDVAKVALICPACKKVTRVGFKVTKEDKNRFCKKCGKTIDLKIDTKK